MAMSRRFYALGRLPAGQMNKTEQAYSDELKKLEAAGEILFWKFEPLKLRLADNTFLTVDFLVIQKNREIELHDSKGSRFTYQEDAKVKMKVAAELFPFFRFKVAFKVKGGWDVEEVGNHGQSE
jgi:hypothetical protein